MTLGPPRNRMHFDGLVFTIVLCCGAAFMVGLIIGLAL